MHVRADSYVYFLLDPKTGLIKIGYSMHPNFRRDELNREFKTQLEWLGAIPGSIEDEKNLHGKYHFDWVEREWFRDSEALRKEAANGVSEMDYVLADGIRQIDRDMDEYLKGNGYRRDKHMRASILWQKQNLFARVTEGKVTFEDWSHAYQPKEKAQ